MKNLKCDLKFASLWFAIGAPLYLFVIVSLFLPMIADYDGGSLSGEIRAWWSEIRLALPFLWFALVVWMRVFQRARRMQDSQSFRGLALVILALSATCAPDVGFVVHRAIVKHDISLLADLLSSVEDPILERIPFVVGSVAFVMIPWWMLRRRLGLGRVLLVDVRA